MSASITKQVASNQSILPLALAFCLCIYCSILHATPPIPSQDELRIVQSELREFYQSELASATTKEKRRELAGLLLEDASESDEDPVAQYALFRAAQVLAIKAEDPKLALEVADGISGNFDIPNGIARAEVITSFDIATIGIERPEKVELAVKSIALIDSAIDEGRIDLAVKLADISAAIAQSARDFRLYRKAKAEQEDLQTIVQEMIVFESAMQKLAEHPGDEAASGLAGRFKCFVCGDWKAGLAVLQNSKDDVLHELAFATLKAEELQAKAAVAHRWWDQADKLTGRRARVVRRQAVLLYQQALEALEGVVRAQAVGRIRTFEQKTIERNRDWARRPVVADVGKAPPPKLPTNQTEQPYTDFGTHELTSGEILFLYRSCMAGKDRVLEGLSAYVNRKGDEMTPSEFESHKKTLNLLAQEHFLIVPRCLEGDSSIDVGKVFKFSSYSPGSGYFSSPMIVDSLRDDGTVVIKDKNGDDPWILEGVDPTSLSKGPLACKLLLQRVPNKEIIGALGDPVSLPTFRAVSLRGFPRGVILW